MAKTTGKVFFTQGGVDYLCSGSAAHSPYGNLVLTAGHCVHDGDGGRFASRWIFYPGWNGSPSQTLGSWTATRLFTTRAWAAGSDGFEDDAGFAVVTGGSSGGPWLVTTTVAPASSSRSTATATRRSPT